MFGAKMPLLSTQIITVGRDRQDLRCYSPQVETSVKRFPKMSCFWHSLRYLMLKYAWPYFCRTNHFENVEARCVLAIIGGTFLPWMTMKKSTMNRSIKLRHRNTVENKEKRNHPYHTKENGKIAMDEKKQHSRDAAAISFLLEQNCWPVWWRLDRINKNCINILMAHS